MYRSLLSWCQTVHSINTATVSVITAPENQIDCVEDEGPTDVMPAPEREKLITKAGTDWINQREQVKQREPFLDRGKIPDRV